MHAPEDKEELKDIASEEELPGNAESPGEKAEIGEDVAEVDFEPSDGKDDVEAANLADANDEDASVEAVFLDSGEIGSEEGIDSSVDGSDGSEANLDPDGEETGDPVGELVEEMSGSADYESREAREIRIMNEFRNSPDDIADVKASEKHSDCDLDSKPKPSAGFRLSEAFIAATAWPAAIIAACFIAIWIILGYCSFSSLAISGVLLALAGIGYTMKRSRVKKFAVIRSDGDGGEYEEKTVSKVHRRQFRAGEYAYILASVILITAFMVLTAFMPIELSFFVSMAIVFAIFWAMAGEFVSSSTPYCDVYDVVFEDGGTSTVISFDTPIPGETRVCRCVDGRRAYMFMLRDTTVAFLNGEDSVFKIGVDNTIVRK